MENKFFEQLWLDLTEAIENGYSYQYCLERARKDYGLSDVTLVKIHELMKNHIWSQDSDYSKFEEDLQNIIIEEE